MLAHKFFEQIYYKTIDQHLSRKLLKSIVPVDANSSDTIVIFNQGHSKYKVKLYSLLSLELSRMGIMSFFFYRNNLLLPYYPEFSVDDFPISSAVKTNKRDMLKRQSLIHLISLSGTLTLIMNALYRRESIFSL